MEHVVELADRAVVLRQGRKVGELRPERSNQQDLVSMIVGRRGMSGIRRPSGPAEESGRHLSRRPRTWEE